MYSRIHIQFVFPQVISHASMPNNVLALAKLYLPLRYQGIAAEYHVNGNFTFLLLSHDQSY